MARYEEMTGWSRVGRLRYAAALVIGLGCATSSPSTVADAPVVMSESESEQELKRALGRCDVERATSVQVGACAPEFSLADSEGASHTLAEYRGRVVVVDLAALW